MNRIKPIKDDRDYQEALAFLEELIERDPALDTPEADQLNVLSTLIDDYESKAFPHHLPTAIDAIKFSMEQRDLKPVDLIPFIGTRARVSEVLSGKRSLSLEMIRAVEAGLGIPAKVLIQKPKAAVFEDWDDSLVTEMSKRGYFADAIFNGANKADLLSAFFGSQTPQLASFAWRKTPSRLTVGSDEQSQTAWAQYIQLKASAIKPLHPYKLGSVNLPFMQEVIRLSVLPDGPVKAQHLLLEKGIRLVIAEKLPKAKVDGVTIINNGMPIIGMSLRFDRVDNFWFTLLHELAHLSMSDDSEPDAIFFDDLENRQVASLDNDEVKVDKLAQEAIVPESKWAISPAKIIPSAMAAESLAKEMNIHVAVIAGYMRYKHKNYFYLTKVVNDKDAKVIHLFNDHWGK
jgi:HTH-type transcriptional regulator/antitoxin HigA